MEGGGVDDRSSIGFISVIDQETGLFGGYLVLNDGGRPLEFHCTAPVRANRAQEILFGPTLTPYLYGEQIARALIEKAKETPSLVLTDTLGVLAVRSFVSIPVAAVHAASGEGEPHSAEPDPPGLSTTRFASGLHRLAVLETHSDDQIAVAQRIESLAGRLDPAEPFCRIRDAITEAQRAA